MTFSNYPVFFIKNIHFSTYLTILTSAKLQDAGFIIIKNTGRVSRNTLRRDRPPNLRLPLYAFPHIYTHTHTRTMVLTPLLCTYTYNSGPMAVVMRGRPWPIVSSSGVRGCRFRRALCRAVHAEYVPWKRSYVIQTSNYGAG